MRDLPPLVEIGPAAFVIDATEDGRVQVQIGTGAHEHHFFLAPGVALVMAADLESAGQRAQARTRGIALANARAE